MTRTAHFHLNELKRENYKSVLQSYASFERGGMQSQAQNVCCCSTYGRPPGGGGGGGGSYCIISNHVIAVSYVEGIESLVGRNRRRRVCGTVYNNVCIHSVARHETSNPCATRPSRDLVGKVQVVLVYVFFFGKEIDRSKAQESHSRSTAAAFPGGYGAEGTFIH